MATWLASPTPLDVSVLSGFEVYRTRNPGIAQEAARKLTTAPHRLDIVGVPSEFEAFARLAPNGGTALAVFHFGAEVTLDRPPSDKYVSFMLPVSGRLVLERQDRQFAADSPGSLLVLSPGHGSTHLHLSAGTTVVAMRVDAAELLEGLRWIAPHADGDRFVATSSLLPAQSSFPINGVTRLFADVFSTYGPGRQVPAPLAKQLREQVISTLWLSVPNNQTETIYHDEGAQYSWTVKQALDVIAAESSAEHSVVDLARVLHVGVRALEIAFRRELNDTPNRYLQRTRMQRVHEELRDADPVDVTVSEVAAKWGFNHLGRFAARYRTEFGNMPSATLRQMRS
jgi:AraC-like DNA-binding protein